MRIKDHQPAKDVRIDDSVYAAVQAPNTPHLTRMGVAMLPYYLNPVRAKLLRDDEPLSHDRWSSSPADLQGQRAPGLRACLPAGRWTACWESWGFPEIVKRFQEVMQKRRFEADGKDYQGLERGGCFGAAEFRQE